MEFFVRYFVELDLPMAVVETALEGLPGEWLVATANKAHTRALGFLLEADPQLGPDLEGTVVDIGLEAAARRGSTAVRTMAWALSEPHSASPLLEADLELGSLGRARCQLAVAGRYYLPGTGTNRRVDRGTAQRVGETTIKEFVDGLANVVERVAFDVPALRARPNVLGGLAPARGLSGGA
jgi:hypothetical protein